MIKLKIKKFHPEAVIPKIATAGAACVDVVATEVIELSEGKVTVKLGFGLDIPEGYKVCLAPRSSFTHKGWVMVNSPAQIDSDYKGEIMLKLDAIPTQINSHTLDTNFIFPHFPYKAGDRVAQMWLEKVISYEFEEVEELSITERGQGSFGHTGN